MADDRRNARSRRTKEAIRRAFREMVSRGEQDGMNVSSLSARAGIHRKTFYLHYESIEALYEDMIEQVAADYAVEVGKLDIPYDYRDLSRVLFEFYTRDAFTEALIADPACTQMFNQLAIKTLAGNRAAYNPFAQLPTAEQTLVNTFASSASNEYFRQWVRSGKKVPLERAAELLGDLLEDGIALLRSNA